MQVNCGIGREQVESWGRKKRSIGEARGGGDHGKSASTAKQQAGTGKPLGDDMTLSREIVVLDLKDKTDANDGSSRDDLSSSSDGFVQKSPLKSPQSAASANQPDQAQSDGAFSNTLDGEFSPQVGSNLHCLSSQSLLWLICSIGLVFIIYVCSVAYFFSRRETKISVIKHQYH